ncbi:hypothetical protein B9Q01_08230 [Candidatus Marsarchaeota G1 archaeon OSP_D]|uniref:Uncharacterized protein n=2 Tax=Candidatus Marsarchaeota group 1 TaxID=2203770 RepID=A0A2R6A7P3_9ARCH|nr:MAG: hypothetical protein B9Q01_08230 [Candidatus Marsarchaeota G1 archaeon OSP_D]PSN87171.1 MAG: hypothetical protein B9Q00_09575 [Candidatus Marsarchaeota G1 archaeon OSP_C]
MTCYSAPTYSSALGPYNFLSLTFGEVKTKLYPLSNDGFPQEHRLCFNLMTSDQKSLRKQK